jgi:flagellar hook-associated protein 3 FlgL
MRIADKMGLDQVQGNLGRNRSELADLQNQAATQKRVTKPSDDPLAATRVLATRTDIASNQQFLKSVNQAKSFLEYSDQSLGELSEVLIRAKELALSQANDAAAGKDTRSVTAAEIDQLFNQTVQVGNRKLGDRFLFGGFKTTRPPFSPKGDYRGDNGEIKIAIQKEGMVALNIPGNRVFLGKGIAKHGHEDDQMPSEMPLKGETVENRQPSSVDSSLNSSMQNDSAVKHDQSSPDLGADWNTKGGVNLFRTLDGLATGLRANDKQAVQESLDSLDEALAQVVLSRAQLGSRVSTLNSAVESISKNQVDSKAMASNLEDVDTFELVSELNKSEGTLKATLETSGKLIQPSLLDFLR